MTSRTLIAAAFVLLSWPGTSIAEPVTAMYLVQVTERMTPQSNPEWLPFQAQEFTLRMTFDPALRAPVNTGFTYGPASFSAVPLPAVAPPGGIVLTTESATFH